MNINKDINGLQAIVKKSADGLLVVDENRVVYFVNPAAESILNRKQKDLIGKLFDYPVEEGQLSRIDIVQKNGKSGSGELRMVDIEWDGQKAYLISIRDITEQIVLDQLKDDFIHNVSHELRTPLTSIRESVTQIHEGLLGKINEDQRNYLDLCIRNVDHLRKIVDGLLDISKIESGKVKLKKEKIDLSDVIRSVLDSFMPVTKKKGLELRINLPEQLMEVYIDRDRIIQVINNLVGNAIKFTDNGTIDVSVTVQKEYAECAVADTGCGISPDDLPKVFDKFQQFGNTQKSGEKGTGLGLAISKEIIRLHGGEISAVSIFDLGSTFTFTIPKYTPTIELRDKIQEKIISSKMPFMLYHFQIHNMPKIEKEIGLQVIQESQDKMKHMLEKLGKHIDAIFGEIDDIIILEESIFMEVARHDRQMKRIVKEAFFESAGDFELEFSYGMASYPKEGQSVDDLMDVCRKNMINEKSQRYNRKLLIVDDEREITDATKTLLGFFGYKNIDTAHCGDEVLEVVKGGIPDLIILDMKMPGMSGYEVIGRLKENLNTKDIPIIIMSGYEVETGQFYKYITGKAILTISKPADEVILKKMIYYLL